jgi:hypothetical protein
VRIFPPFFATGLFALIATGLATTNVAHAQGSDDPPRGAASLERAQAAWNRGEFDTAETLYREALDQGGLQRKDVIDAYVFMGAARAVQNKKEPALTAFREAALLDPKFKTPSEAGKKASQLAEVARKQQAKIGQIALKVDMPQSIAVAEAFSVNVTLDPSHVALLTRIGLSVNDGLGQKPFVFEQPAGTELRFSVPGKVAISDARLVVKLVGLDAHDNELVTADGHVQVRASGAKAVVPVAGGDPTHANGGGDTTKKDTGSKSIWSTPWPYLIGGVALAGAGGAVYFATRPGDQVNVTAVRVQAVR